MHVANVEEAVEFYTKKLGLVKKTDVTVGPELRWVTVGPEGQDTPEIFLKNPQDWYDKETAKKTLT